MPDQYQHLGIYSGLVSAAKNQQPLFQSAAPGAALQTQIRESLGFCHKDEQPVDVRVEKTWEKDGLAGEEISWSVGFGPRTHAYVLKPAACTQKLPAVAALHDHSDFKFFGKEKIADGPDAPLSIIEDFRKTPYSGLAYANELAREGFVVLVHDVFLWGSRRFPLDTMLEMMGPKTAELINLKPSADEYELYNTTAYFHEHWVSKYCNILGTSMAGIAAFEDRIAFNYLLSRSDVDTENTGCIGLSGGGNRAAYLHALHDGCRAAVIIGLMTTYQALLDHNMSHTWMLFPFGWSRQGDWPDIAACRAPSPLLVQYDLDDSLFTETGMRDAHKKLQEHFSAAGKPEAYTGQFFPGPHKFDREMQSIAFHWLKEQLYK